MADQPNPDDIPANLQEAMGGWNHLTFAVAHHVPTAVMRTTRLANAVLDELKRLRPHK